MSNTSLLEQIELCADNIGVNEKTCNVMTNVWLDFESYMAENSVRPTRLQDLNMATLSTFVEIRSKRCADVELLLLEITCLRLVLLESGFAHKELTDLRVRIKRKRLGNDKNGKYRFAKVLCP
ncbi:hypothetical protein [Paraburkholderia sp. BR10954]|uniref:hypothetical protein n=1 Tax=Paraburkholderia sp. BR10954 TaxID=3236995 RepID=UPI0034D25496